MWIPKKSTKRKVYFIDINSDDGYEFVNSAIIKKLSEEVAYFCNFQYTHGVVGCENIRNLFSYRIEARLHLFIKRITKAFSEF